MTPNNITQIWPKVLKKDPWFTQSLGSFLIINQPTSTTIKLFPQRPFYLKLHFKSIVIFGQPLNGDVWAPGDKLISLISDCAGHSVPSGFFAFNGRPAGNVGKMTADITITVQSVAQLMCSMCLMETKRTTVNGTSWNCTSTPISHLLNINAL